MRWRKLQNEGFIIEEVKPGVIDSEGGEPSLTVRSFQGKEREGYQDPVLPLGGARDDPGFRYKGGSKVGGGVRGDDLHWIILLR